MIRIGIIGIGNMGSVHAKYLFNKEITDATLGAVCDTDPARLAWAKETFGEELPTFSDAYEMIGSGTVDAVIVAVPHYQHPEYSIAAMKAGLHVICEKPAGVYTKQVREMNKVAMESDCVFSMMFNQRTNPVYRKVKEMIDAGELGKIKRMNWIITNWFRTQSYYNSGGWRATWAGEGGGVLLNQCPHNIDLWQWMFGMPKKVTSFMTFGKFHDIEVEDDVTTYMEYENGATGIFITTTGDAPGTNRLEVTGEMGKIIVELGLDWKLKTTFVKNSVSDKEFSDTCEKGFDQPSRKEVPVEITGVETSHKGITQNFVNAIVHGEPLIASGTEGINGLTLSNAMHLSAFKGSVTVSLPFDEEEYYTLLSEKVKGSKIKENVKAQVQDMGASFNDSTKK